MWECFLERDAQVTVCGGYGQAARQQPVSGEGMREVQKDGLCSAPQDMIAAPVARGHGVFWQSSVLYVTE